MDEKAKCQRFNELDEHTKVFLESLTPEKIRAIEKGIKTSEALEVLGKFWRWTFLFIVAAFTGAAALGQSVEWLWMKFKGGG